MTTWAGPHPPTPDKGLNTVAPHMTEAFWGTYNVVYLIKRRRILAIARGKKRAQKATR